MAIVNPDIADRADQTFFTGPIGNDTTVTPIVTLGTPTIADGIPTADPGVAGQLWQDPLTPFGVFVSQG